jgi:hypothetical protein
MSKRNRQKKRMEKLQRKVHSNNPHTRKTDEDCTLDGLPSTYPILIDNVPFEVTIGEIRCPNAGTPEGNNYGKILYDNLLAAKDATLKDPKCNATVGGKITSPSIVHCFNVYDYENRDDCKSGSTYGYPLAQLTRQNTTLPPDGDCIDRHFLLNPSLSSENINQEIDGRAFLPTVEMIAGAAAAAVLILLSLAFCILCLLAVPLLGSHLVNKITKNAQKRSNANEGRQLLTKNPMTLSYYTKPRAPADTPPAEQPRKQMK